MTAALKTLAASLLLAAGALGADAGPGAAPAGDGSAALQPIAVGRVILLVPPGPASRADYRRLAADLDRAAAEMAPRVPLAAGDLVARPIRVVVETDFSAEVRHTGRIGEAVPAAGTDAADLHLVVDPADLFAYRRALAALLIARSGAVSELPPWLGRGAALWLSGDWYGRTWREWLPALAAAEAFPDADQLLAAGEQEDGSAPLWTPAAAAVVDALAGDTLAAKLGEVPGRGTVTTLLVRAERTARAAAGRDAVAWRPSGPALPVPFLRGVSLAMLNSVDGGYQAPAVDGQLERLAALGADAVSLMPFAYQRDPHRPGLVFLNRSPESETDVGTVHAARRAHAHGFRVLWKPHLWISGRSWPGEVAMTDEADWDAWWASYRRFVLHHAFLAAWAHAELFSVGVELSATLGREAEWRRLIADVRRLYPGLVTYSANWGDDLERVKFWDALDLVGVDAYYPLAPTLEATAGGPRPRRRGGGGPAGPRSQGGGPAAAADRGRLRRQARRLVRGAPRGWRLRRGRPGRRLPGSSRRPRPSPLAGRPLRLEGFQWAGGRPPARPAGRFSLSGPAGGGGVAAILGRPAAQTGQSAILSRCTRISSPPRSPPPRPAPPSCGVRSATPRWPSSARGRTTSSPPPTARASGRSWRRSAAAIPITPSSPRRGAEATAAATSSG